MARINSRAKGLNEWKLLDLDTLIKYGTESIGNSNNS